MNITSKDGCWSIKEVLTELLQQRHGLLHKGRSSCGRRHLTEASDGRKEGFLLRGGRGSGIDCGCGHRSWKHLLPLLSCSPPSFSFYPTGMPAQGRCGPHLRWVFPPQWDVTGNGLADILRSVSLAWVQIQQSWQPRLTVLVMEKIKLDILGHSINYMKKLF